MSPAQVPQADPFADPEPSPSPRADTNDEKPSPKRPAYNDFSHQRLGAWQPMLTPKSVLPIFFFLAVLFAIIGGVLLRASNLVLLALNTCIIGIGPKLTLVQVQELQLDYTHCFDSAPVAPAFGLMSKDQVSYTFKSKAPGNGPYWQRNSTKGPISCTLQFGIPETMGPPVFMYYRLTEFHQNHRKYSDSINVEQLKGGALSNATIFGSSDFDSCDWETSVNLDCETKKAYYPAGAVANSLFNDTIHSPKIQILGDWKEYYMTDKGISWPSDKELVKPTEYKNWEVMPPRNWRERYPNGYTPENPIPNLQEDEAFLVWMRTAALPTFSKMSRRNDTNGMSTGTYQMTIYDRFRVDMYNGTKSILLSTGTSLGGKNSFMGIGYIVVACVCGLFGAMFTVAHAVRPRKLGDDKYLSWAEK